MVRFSMMWYSLEQETFYRVALIFIIIIATAIRVNTF